MVPPGFNPHIYDPTPQQVQAVARKYLVDDRLTVAELVPQPIDTARPPRTGGAAHAH